MSNQAPPPLQYNAYGEAVDPNAPVTYRAPPPPMWRSKLNIPLPWPDFSGKWHLAILNTIPFLVMVSSEYEYLFTIGMATYVIPFSSWILTMFANWENDGTRPGSCPVFLEHLYAITNHGPLVLPGGFGGIILSRYFPCRAGFYRFPVNSSAWAYAWPKTVSFQTRLSAVGGLVWVGVQSSFVAIGYPDDDGDYLLRASVIWACHAIVALFALVALIRGPPELAEAHALVHSEDKDDVEVGNVVPPGKAMDQSGSTGSRRNGGGSLRGKSPRGSRRSKGSTRGSHGSKRSPRRNEE